MWREDLDGREKISTGPVRADGIRDTHGNEALGFRIDISTEYTMGKNFYALAAVVAFFIMATVEHQLYSTMPPSISITVITMPMGT